MAGEIVDSDLSQAKPDQAVSSQVVEGSVRSSVPARTPSWYEQELPYEELVGNVRHLIEQARERHQRGHPDGSFSANEPFEPAEWLGWHLRKEAGNGIHQGEAQSQLMDLWAAWDALYYTRYPSEGGGWRNMVRSELEFRAGEMKQPAITLTPKSVTLLDAMAEAAGLPRKRGEATIDLTPFSHTVDTPLSQPRENKSIIRRPLR
jgi:hypothetical protein